MSDLSPQFAPQIALLLAPAQAGGQASASASRAPGTVSRPPPGAAQGAAETLAPSDFAQSLQALLSSVESAAGLTSPAVAAAGPPVGMPDGGPVAGTDAVALSATAGTSQGGKPLPATGSTLPPGGKNLPLNASAAAPATPVESAAAGAQQRPPLSLESAAAERDAAPAMVAAATPEGAEGEGTATAADARRRSAANELLNRILSGAATAKPAAEASSAAERPADARTLNAVVTPSATEASARRSGSMAAGGSALIAEALAAAAGDGEMPKGALGDLLAARADAAKLAAAPETAAQFSLHARPAEALLLPTQSVATDATLRDLQSMPPMRPQTGEAGQAFAQGLGQRLVLMAENGIESARLRLNPANLGALDIQISVEDDRAQVSFGVQHSSTREALEAALPRLRELFAAQGLELTQADVRDGDSGTPTNEGRDPQDTGAVTGLAMSAEVVGDPATLFRTDTGRALDIFV